MSSGPSTWTASMAERLAEDNGQAILKIVWLLTIFTGCFVALRLYSKLIRVLKLHIDDVLLCLSWIFLLASAIMSTRSIPLGLGKHFLTVPFANYTKLALLSMVNALLTLVSSGVGKTSFAITIYRMLPYGLGVLLIFLVSLMNMTLVAAILLSWFQCDPPEKRWNFMLPGSCPLETVNLRFLVFTAAFSGFVDLALTAMVLPILWGLNIRRAEKLGVAFAMSMGVVAGVTTFIKAYFIPQLQTVDPTFNSLHLIAWTYAEAAATLMGASVPALRVLLRGAWIRPSSSHSHSGGWRNAAADERNGNGNGHRGSSHSDARVPLQGAGAAHLEADIPGTALSTLDAKVVPLPTCRELAEWSDGRRLVPAVTAAAAAGKERGVVVGEWSGFAVNEERCDLEIVMMDWTDVQAARTLVDREEKEARELRENEPSRVSKESWADKTAMTLSDEEEADRDRVIRGSIVENDAKHGVLGICMADQRHAVDTCLMCQVGVGRVPHR